MSDLKTAAKELVKALDATDKALRKYADAALAIGRESGDPTARGMDAKQVRRRLNAEVVARLSPKPAFGLPAPILQLDGAPEARRYCAAHPLPGL
jgi:hypothetical protein